MQKDAFYLIQKRTSDQTTNHPKKSKKRTGHMLGNYLFNVQIKNRNTQQLLLSESSDEEETSYCRRDKRIKDLY